MKVDDMGLYVKSTVNGRMIKVTAIFIDLNECNRYLENHKDEGVISNDTYDPEFCRIIVGNMADRGEYFEL